MPSYSAYGELHFRELWEIFSVHYASYRLLPQTVYFLSHFDFLDREVGPMTNRVSARPVRFRSLWLR